MAAKKPTKTAAKTAKPANPAPVEVLSDKDLVLKSSGKAKCKPIKNGFVIFSGDIPLHSGIAQSESDAWKLAARFV